MKEEGKKGGEGGEDKTSSYERNTDYENLSCGLRGASRKRRTHTYTHTRTHTLGAICAYYEGGDDACELDPAGP